MTSDTQPFLDEQLYDFLLYIKDHWGSLYSNVVVSHRVKDSFEALVAEEDEGFLAKDSHGNSLLHYAIRFELDEKSTEFLFNYLCNQVPEDLGRLVFDHKNDDGKSILDLAHESIPSIYKMVLRAHYHFHQDLEKVKSDARRYITKNTKMYGLDPFTERVMYDFLESAKIKVEESPIIDEIKGRLKTIKNKYQLIQAGIHNAQEGNGLDKVLSSCVATQAVMGGEENGS